MSTIPDEVRRRLELQYAPTQSLGSIEVHHGQNQETNILPDSHCVGPTDPEVEHHDPNNDNGRSLPKCPVSEDNIALQYADFILYCNPTVPLDTDTTELKAIFRAPPKSDGKSFSTWTLFDLIKKLEKKEIKTWAQLAIDLGVELPVLEKGQSAQKVQQYAVRLKRWMRAMHVDAYFEYLMGKSHIYWSQVPSANELLPESGRDGVAPEEDLALRALLPETRPKRGRRKNEDREDNELGKPPSQRPRLHSPTLSEDFFMARTAIVPEGGPSVVETNFDPSLNDRMAPWSAIEARGQLGAFRWPDPSDHLNTPLNAHPQSAITPTNRVDMWHDEPRSAITPKSKARRRHGPAVSSAWPSNSASNPGKLRGRPPSNRNVTDGPFSTFPATPTARDMPAINLRGNTPISTPVVADLAVPHIFHPPRPPPLNSNAQSNRPSRLSLQVPQREGGSVRLATPPPLPTPPPVLLINGNADIESNQFSGDHQFTPPIGPFIVSCLREPESTQNSAGFSFRTSDDPKDNTNMEALESHLIREILAANWINPQQESIEMCTIEEADQICTQFVKNLHSESKSPEAFLINLSALLGGPLVSQLRITRLHNGSVTYFNGCWKLKLGLIHGECRIRAFIDRGAKPPEVEVPEILEQDWKKKYMELQQQVKEKDVKIEGLKKDVLDALVRSNQQPKTLNLEHTGLELPNDSFRSHAT